MKFVLIVMILASDPGPEPRADAFETLDACVAHAQTMREELIKKWSYQAEAFGTFCLEIGEDNT
jgi:hypothetical protein